MKTAEEWAAEFFVDAKLQGSLIPLIREVQADAIHSAAKLVRKSAEVQTSNQIKELVTAELEPNPT